MKKSLKKLSDLLKEIEACKSTFAYFKDRSSRELRHFSIRFVEKGDNSRDGHDFYLSTTGSVVDGEAIEKIKQLMINHYYNKIRYLNEEIKKQATVIASAGE